MLETKVIKTKKFFKEALKNVIITDERKELLTSIAQFIINERLSLKKVRLNFICTHNSRRSQLSQVWAHYAMFYYKLKRIKSFSGGTEVTSFHKNTVKTLQDVGFKFSLKTFSHTNPVYEISNINIKKPIIVFSKLFDDKTIKKPFIAITTCSNAAKNCPFITDALKRFHVGYVDPKASDNTPEMTRTYLKTNQQIAAEMNFLFLQVVELS